MCEEEDAVRGREREEGREGVRTEVRLTMRKSSLWFSVLVSGELVEKGVVGNINK